MHMHYYVFLSDKPYFNKNCNRLMKHLTSLINNYLPMHMYSIYKAPDLLEHRSILVYDTLVAMLH